jgi:hypothetical protein
MLGPTGIISQGGYCPPIPSPPKPCCTTWDVEYKQGCCWVYIGCYTCLSDLTAARYYYNHGFPYKVMRVRAASSLGVDAGPWRVIRFR